MPSAPHTPAIAGFYPDPTICRVGSAFYLANSSFEYRPGVPIHRSDDLLTWHPIGHALETTTLLPDSDGEGSSGIFAPTLRHHDGRFWLIITNLAGGVPEQTLLHADHIEGPWSAPVHTQGAVGIDPDIAWDGEDCYLTWAAFSESGSHIASARIDPYTATLLEAPRQLWSGGGYAFPEGPHLFRRGSWWYLLIAEGGTERGHCVSIARGESPQGPFAASPSNPILSHRSLAHPVQNTGHADLVEREDGTWAMVYLGVRPRGTSPGFHTNGRETFVAGISWVDDWPIVDENAFAAPGADHSFVDTFTEDRLDSRWVSAGVFPDSFTSLGSGGVAIRSTTGPDHERFIGVRTRDESWSARATLHDTTDAASLRVWIDEQHACEVIASAGEITAVQTLGGVRTELGALDIGPDSDVELLISARSLRSGAISRSGPDELTLGARVDGIDRVLASLDGRYLSTEVAGGFTGRMVGVGALRGSTTLLRFQYTGEAA